MLGTLTSGIHRRAAVFSSRNLGPVLCVKILVITYIIVLRHFIRNIDNTLLTNTAV